MNPLEIFEGSNGAATQALYRELEALGPAGVIAMNLFRACKCSGRAKKYRGRGFKDAAYGRKEFSLFNLCEMLEAHADNLGIAWGWKEDEKQPVHRWVLYVEIPTGQVSFHSEKRINQKDFAGEWDETTSSSTRIIRWTNKLLHEGPYEPPARTQHPEPMPRMSEHKLGKEEPTRKPVQGRLEMLELWEVALRTSID